LITAAASKKGQNGHVTQRGLTGRCKDLTQSCGEKNSKKRLLSSLNRGVRSTGMGSLAFPVNSKTTATFSSLGTRGA